MLIDVRHDDDDDDDDDDTDEDKDDATSTLLASCIISSLATGTSVRKGSGKSQSNSIRRFKPLFDI